MAITLITGVPGAGKTLKAIELIHAQVQINNDPKTDKLKRPIYSDIDGLNFGGDVYTIDDKHDWRDCPDGSLVVYDEVHRRWPATGKTGRSEDITARELDTHRHRGFDFIIISQWPTKIHFEVRTNVTEHLHISRVAGAKYANVFKWDSAQGSPDDYHAKEKADTSSFPYPKKLFKFYKSATIHTHKFKIPKKLIFFAVLALIPALYVVKTLVSGETFFTQGFTPSTNSTIEKAPETLAFGASPSTIIIPIHKPLLAGCVASRTFCHCYTDEGKIIDQDLATCLNTLERPLAFPLVIEKKS